MKCKDYKKIKIQAKTTPTEKFLDKLAWKKVFKNYSYLGNAYSKRNLWNDPKYIKNVTLFLKGFYESTQTRERKKKDSQKELKIQKPTIQM